MSAVVEKKKKSIPRRIIGWFVDLFHDIKDLMADDQVREAVLADLGLDPKTDARLDLPKDSLDSIEKYRENAPDKADDLALLSTLQDLQTLFQAVKAFIAACGASGDDAVEEYFHHFFKLMSVNFIRLRLPALYWVAQPLGFIEESTSILTSGETYPERILSLFKAPKDYFAQLGSLATEQDARVLSDTVFFPLATLFAVLEFRISNKDGRDAIDVLYGWEPSPDSGTPFADRIADRTLALRFGDRRKAVVFNLAWLPREYGEAGLFAACGGAFEVLQTIDKDWQLRVKAESADAFDFFIGENGFSLNGPADVKVSFSFDRASFFQLPKKAFESITTAEIPSAVLKTLEKDGLLLQKFNTVTAATDFLRAEFEALSPKPSKEDAEKFEQAILAPLAFPPEAYGLPFVIGSEHGTRLEFGPLSFSGEGSVQKMEFLLSAKNSALVISKNNVDSFTGEVLPDSETRMAFNLGLGLSFGRGFYFEGGSGLQTVIPVNRSAGPVTIQHLLLGLIATRLPDRAKGFSLLIVITAEGLKAFPLPLGFRLTGLGGLLAVNRTFSEEVLRSGLKNHTLDSVLFPKDPIRNAPQMLSNLNRAFPPANGHHLFGPMAQIEWAAPPLITAELAIILEFGVRLRLLVLAQVTAILPKREHDLVRLQMDGIGVLDFDQGSAALDATLYDSRLLKKFVLTGDMAMRLKWDGARNFALAVGGLHPAFNPPPAFPKLERIAINLTTGNNPRFRCKAYFALTSNTLQFGARAELYAAAAGFSIQGQTGFDVLIQRDPFFFLADFHAQVQLKRGSTNLFKVKVAGALAGPRPLHLKGKATFEILWWDVSIRIDATLVEGERPPRPAPVDAMPLLKAALADPANWKSQLPSGQGSMVTLRETPQTANGLSLHPLGTLTVKQSVVPLNMDISLFGQAAPAGARRFTITGATLADENQALVPVRDFFAPAQFFEMSDDEKLSRPSFESLPAGIGIGSDEIVLTDQAEDWLEIKTIEFEIWIIDKSTGQSRLSTPEDAERPDSPKNLYALSPALLERQALFGAAASSEIRRAGKEKYRSGTARYRMAKAGWNIVAVDDLTVQTPEGMDKDQQASYSEALQALHRLQDKTPATAAGLKILRLSDLRATV